MTQTYDILTIHHLGHQGDGLAHAPHGTVFVAGALAGEVVEVAYPNKEGNPHTDLAMRSDRAVVRRVITPSLQRAVPPCPHFGTCGGCVAQHMSASLYAQWKRDTLLATLESAGLALDEAIIQPIHAVAAGTRRRVTLALARSDTGPVLGFHTAKSAQIIQLTACAVADPQIIAALPVLRAVLGALAPPKGTAEVSVLVTKNGLDVAVNGIAKPSPKQREGLILGAERHQIARLSIGGEILVTYRTPTLEMSGAQLIPPPGGFVQAVPSAEEALVEHVVKATVKAKRVVDLFCGSGTFTVPLARHSSVTAVEGEASALAALDMARRTLTGLKPITLHQLDLFRYPLQLSQLKEVDAVVLDPPRQGAASQIGVLARASVPLIVYVSCNPSSFGRDASQLLEAGYSMQSLLPIDQFLWSAHLELVAVFTKSIPRPKRRG